MTETSDKPEPPAAAGPAEASAEAAPSSGKSEDAAPTERQPPQRAKAGFVPSARNLWAFLVETYGTVDPRSLGLFRIALGLLLFVDVARRFPDIAAHYSNDGWLTNHFMLFRPMSSHLFSLYLAFSSTAEV